MYLLTYICWPVRPSAPPGCHPAGRQAAPGMPAGGGPSININNSNDNNNNNEYNSNCNSSSNSNNSNNDDNSSNSSRTWLRPLCVLKQIPL